MSQRPRPCGEVPPAAAAAATTSCSRWCRRPHPHSCVAAASSSISAAGKKKMDTNKFGKNKGKHMVGNDGGQYSARWDDHSNRMFVDLCDEEIRKGNRLGGSFNINGWNTIMTKFKEITGKDYNKKQLKNHWDCMKNDWSCYKQLMHGETGLGWDDVRNMIVANEEWWNAKISANKAFKKFKNKDLYLIKYRYDDLFGDVVAYGERARAPSQFDVEVEPDYNEDELEGSGDSNDVQKRVGNEQAQDYSFESSMFSTARTKRKSSEGNNSGRKKKLSGAARLESTIDSFMQVLLAKSTATSSGSIGNEPSIEHCMDLLEAIPGIAIGDQLYNYGCALFCKKAVKGVFARIPTSAARKSWLEFMYSQEVGLISSSPSPPSP